MYNLHITLFNIKMYKVYECTAKCDPNQMKWFGIKDRF